MVMDALVLGNNILCSARTAPFAGGLAIREGRIAAVLDLASALEARSTAAAVIDAGDRLVLPGLVDGHVHLRDPGQTHKEDFASGTRAAAAGGVTTVVAQPNTKPEIADAAAFEEVRRIGAARAVVDFGVAARIDPSHAERAGELAAAGAACFDFVTGSCSPAELVAILKIAAALPPVLGCYCEDTALSASASRSAAAAGLTGPDAFLAELPDEAETAAAAQVFFLAQALGARLLFRQISTASTLAFLSAARRLRPDADLAVEVNPHHLELTHDDTHRLGTAAKIRPPLRTATDCAALWQGLATGAIDLVGTDHAPHAPEEKSRDFAEAPPGFPGLETLLPVLMNGVAQGHLTLGRLVEVACEAPARLYGFADRKGRLAPGMDADLVIIDEKMLRQLDPAGLQTKAQRSPFEGRSLQGWPVFTMVRGVPAWEEGRHLADAGSGRFLPARFSLPRQASNTKGEKP